MVNLAKYASLKYTCDIMERVCAMYVWPDGQAPTQFLRSKTKILDNPVTELKEIPSWGFDGSSTYQAEGHKSDCILKPIRFIKDPILGDPHIIVLCEVFLPNGTPHPSNSRAVLRRIAKRHESFEPLFGIEQEYTLYDENGQRPYRWPVGHGYPDAQGRFYCGVGADEINGRNLVTQHTFACMKAGISISGTNPEVMPSQWEFQVGPLDPLAVCDELILARWLLYRLGEDFHITVKLRPKPVEAGEWNGAGAHTNFSTNKTRQAGGMKEIEKACRKLGRFHDQHVLPHIYGDNNEKRLTGKYETAHISEFRYGVGDRGGSVRIPAPVAKAGKGYLEDRRPAANMDPYRVVTAVLETVCGKGFNPNLFKYFTERKGEAHLR